MFRSRCPIVIKNPRNTTKDKKMQNLTILNNLVKHAHKNKKSNNSFPTSIHTDSVHNYNWVYYNIIPQH